MFSTEEVSIVNTAWSACTQVITMLPIAPQNRQTPLWLKVNATIVNILTFYKNFNFLKFYTNIYLSSRCPV